MVSPRYAPSGPLIPAAAVTVPTLAEVLAEGNDADGSVIEGVGTPVAATDAATKDYVDGGGSFTASVTGTAVALSTNLTLTQVLAGSNYSIVGNEVHVERPGRYRATFCGGIQNSSASATIGVGALLLTGTGPSTFVISRGQQTRDGTTGTVFIALNGLVDITDIETQFIRVWGDGPINNTVTIANGVLTLEWVGPL